MGGPRAASVPAVFWRATSASHDRTAHRAASAWCRGSPGASRAASNIRAAASYSPAPKVHSARASARVSAPFAPGVTCRIAA